MDVNVKGLEPEVAERLAQQAAAEGLSQQEWIRQVLRRTAGRLSPAELVEQRESLEPISGDDFEKIQAAVARRRRQRAKSLGARRRRR